MQVKFWGVRGSLPYTMTTKGWVHHFESLMQDFFKEGFSSSQHIQEFIQKKGNLLVGDVGSATTCVTVTSRDQTLIIDAGSGIKHYSESLSHQNSSIKKHHILMTHFHYDHVIGAPFFNPHFTAGSEVHYYFVQDNGKEIIKQIFSRPFFPVPFEKLEAKFFFHKLNPYQENKIDHFTIIPYKTDHPDICYGFKISDGQLTYSHAVDNECIRTSSANLDRDSGLYQNTDLLYIDTQFEKNKYQEGWGHGTLEKALQICNEFKVSRVVFGHHDMLTQAKDLIKISTAQSGQLSQLDWQWAYDGLSINLNK